MSPSNIRATATEVNGNYIKLCLVMAISFVCLLQTDKNNSQKHRLLIGIQKSLAEYNKNCNFICLSFQGKKKKKKKNLPMP